MMMQEPSISTPVSNPATPLTTLAYYSGTGTTEWAAFQLRNQLEAAGFPVQTLRIRNGSEPARLTTERLILLYAVHACNAPRAVYEWLDRLPAGSGTPAVVLSVSGGGEVFPNLACRTQCIRRLEKKGYRVEYEDMIVMPSNWIVATKEPLALMLLEILPKKLARMMADWAAGTVRRTRSGPVDRLVARFGELEKLGAIEFGKRIRVSNTCTGCGICAANCPAGNISMETGHPVFGKQCHLCLSCLYGCLAKALSPGMGKFVLIPGGFSLKKLEEKLPLREPADVEALAKGYLWLGVKKYLLE